MRCLRANLWVLSRGRAPHVRPSQLLRGAHSEPDPAPGSTAYRAAQKDNRGGPGGRHADQGSHQIPAHICIYSDTSGRHSVAGLTVPDPVGACAVEAARIGP